MRESQQMASETFGSRQTTSSERDPTANKIVLQALLAPGDIVLVDRNVNSKNYGLMMAGAEGTYLKSIPLNENSRYGAVTLRRSVQNSLSRLRAAGKLDRVRL